MTYVCCVLLGLQLTMVPFTARAEEGTTEHKSHWGYEGEAGPDFWGDLKPEYKTCKLGKAQSPVNIVAKMGVKMAPLSFKYKSSSLRILNNGHTIQANYDAGSAIEIEGKEYNLL